MIGAVGSQGMVTHAQMRPPPPPPKELFEQVDSDSDGVLNEAELEEMVANGPAQGATASELIEQFDTDGDNALSLEEMTAMHEAHRAEMASNRPNAQFPMGDLLSLLQTDAGKEILQGIVSELFAQYQGEATTNPWATSIDLAG